MSKRTYRIPLDLTPQPEGGYTVTSSLLPELITEGDTVEEALANAREVFDVVLEIYEDQGRAFPVGPLEESPQGTIHIDHLAFA